MLDIPATWEAEAGGFQVQDQFGQKNQFPVSNFKKDDIAQG